MHRFLPLAAVPLMVACVATLRVAAAARGLGTAEGADRRGCLRRLAAGQTGRPPADQAGRPAEALRHRIGLERARHGQDAGRARSRSCRRASRSRWSTAGVAQPRVIRVAPNGDLFVADSRANTVRVYRIPDGSAKPAEDERLRERPAPALWHRLLSARAEPGMDLRRQQRQRRPLSLQERRPRRRPASRR